MRWIILLEVTSRVDLFSPFFLTIHRTRSVYAEHHRCLIRRKCILVTSIGQTFLDR